MTIVNRQRDAVAYLPNHVLNVIGRDARNPNLMLVRIEPDKAVWIRANVNLKG